MPIYNNVVFLSDGVEDDIQEVVIFLTSPCPRLFALYQLNGIVDEVVEHNVIFFFIKNPMSTHFLFLQIEN